MHSAALERPIYLSTLHDIACSLLHLESTFNKLVQNDNNFNNKQVFYGLQESPLGDLLRLTF